MKYGTCKLKTLEKTGFWVLGQSLPASVEQIFLSEK